jgi:hypothetical protein
MGSRETAVGLLQMTRDELWARYVKRNPVFDRGGMVTLSARGLKKMFDTTWAIARRSATEQFDETRAAGDSRAFDHLFKTFFHK